jgi:osmotically inducible protein OsmC
MSPDLYTARVDTRGGRAHGLARSSDGLLDIRLSKPGTGRLGTNPEQLLAAAWSACFGSSIVTAARRRGLVLAVAPDVAAEVSLERADSGCILSVHLHIRLDGLDLKNAKALVNEADRICPYSKATRDRIDVAISIS